MSRGSRESEKPLRARDTTAWKLVPCGAEALSCEAYLVKREAQDGRRKYLIFVCEIRATLHERRDWTQLA